MALFRQRDGGLVEQVGDECHVNRSGEKRIYAWHYKTTCCGYKFRTVDKPLDEQTFICPQCRLDEVRDVIDRLNTKIASACGVDFAMIGTEDDDDAT